MYRVMLIDDELSARRLLRAAISKNDFGMEVVGEAENGIEAINIIDEIKPDIAFVDISMPFMNGIEFAEIAAERYPTLLMIVMTAMDEFEYARRCIRLNVFEYMLKPIIRAEVAETLMRAKARLDSETRLPVIEKRKDTEPTLIQEIRTYMSENYTNSSINLTSTAQLFGISPSYLSRRFKQETGKSFVEYLTQCRMERAMTLASKNMKMFSTAVAVGIPDPNYFGRCFKKYTGISYSEYVKQSTAGK